MEPVKVGIVGCGNISPIYLTNCTKSRALEVVAVADLIEERMQTKAKDFNIPHVYETADLMADPSIEMVINLTQPENHAGVNMQALNAGKHVHVEKPLSVSKEDGMAAVKLAEAKGLRLGGAPDTFLGAGYQTCRKLIDDGWIGTPVAAVAFMLNHGHESWHPDPEFYYQIGGGPMFDMGPYYLTALIHLLGPIKRVSGSAQVSFPQRTITSEKKYGKVIDVEVPTHIAGVMDFESGAVGTIITSFDVWAAEVPFIEIYGSQGTLSCPDPNTFGGPVRVKRAGQDHWQEVPLMFGHAENSRGLGPEDMAYAIREGRKHRAHSEMTYHVLDTMHGFHHASRDGRYYELNSTCQRPEPFPLNTGAAE